MTQDRRTFFHRGALRTIPQLKEEARLKYQKFLALTADYSCGANLTAYINPEASRAAREFNEAMQVLAENDSACPKFTLLPEGK